MGTHAQGPYPYPYPSLPFPTPFLPLSTKYHIRSIAGHWEHDGRLVYPSDKQYIYVTKPAVVLSKTFPTNRETFPETIRLNTLYLN